MHFSTRLFLSLALLLTGLPSAMAATTVVYISGDDTDGIAVEIGDKKQLVNQAGFAIFDLDPGSYDAVFTQFAEWIGETPLTIEAADTDKDIFVEMLGGEAVAEVRPADKTATGVVSGRLISRETGGPVAGARVGVVDSDIGVMSDDDGAFELELPRGKYDLKVADPNYNRKEIRGVYSLPGVPISLDIDLSLAGSGVIEEVVAVGTYIPATSTAQERDASAVLDSIGAEQMSRFGDSSAASALTRVAGVSVVGGQYAVVRGMAGRYISSTLNGSLMPSTDPMKRDVPLDLFPASVLGGIDIQKAFTPDLPGDSTGGAIRMTTKGLPDDGSGSKITATLGMNSRTTFSDINGYEGGSTDFLGFDDGTREMPTYADDLTDGGRDSVNYCANTSLCLTPEQGVELSESFENIYNVSQVQAKPEKGFSVSTGNLYDSGFGNYFAFQYKDKWSARHDAQIDDAGTVGSYERTKRNIDVTGYMAIGKDADNWSVLSKTILLRKTDNTIKTSSVFDDSKDQDNDTILLQWVERQYVGQQFSGDFFWNTGSVEHTLEWRAGIAQTGRYEPDRRQYSFINGNILPGSLERRFSDLTETALDFGLDYKLEWMIDDSFYARLKTGLMANNKDRDVELGRFGILTLNSGADQTGSLEEILSDQAFENGDYAVTTRTADTDNYSAKDEMLAAYLTGELEYYDYTLIAGARVEDATQSLEYPDAPSADNELESNKVLPMIGAVWRATEELQFRASMSQTISRPGLTERSESAQYDPDTDDLIRGNPDLVISDITNLDLRAEYYFSDDESITLALFNKTVDAPIERTVIEGDGSAVDGFTYQNEDTATLSGVELDFRKNTFEGDSFSTFVGGNLSYIDSEVTLSANSAKLEGIETRQLQGQSEILGNLQLGFDHYPTGQSLTLLINYYDDRIYAVSRGAFGLEMEDGRTTFDLVYQYDVNENLKIKAKAKNLTDAKVSYSRDDREIESYYEGTDYTASVEYMF